jgi:ABC-2 type transport system ATP-binding protein
MSSTAALEFHSVSKIYRTGFICKSQVRAVTDVSFRVEPGEVFALLGPNRAGKTTLVKMLLSLVRPTGGRITRLGQPGTVRSTLARVGYVHENQAFPRYLSATALLEFYGALSRLPQEVVQKRTGELLERVGLADRAREPIARFSKGMVQRLALAQALLCDPELLVLDEPSEGLDLAGRRLVREVAGELRNRGRTVLLVSHVLAEVEQVCDRVAVLTEGRLTHLGPVGALTRDTGRSLEQAVQELYERVAA